MLDLLGQLLGRQITMRLKEDNAATLSILHSGYSVKLRHASRTHRIDLASLAELMNERHMQPEHVNSEDQSADALTKVIQPMPWDRLLATQNEGGVEWDIHFWYITFLRRCRTRKLKGHAFTHCLTCGFTWFNMLLLAQVKQSGVFVCAGTG